MRTISPPRAGSDAANSQYKINGRTVTHEAYDARLATFAILVKARNFLVFQVRPRCPTRALASPTAVIGATGCERAEAIAQPDTCRTARIVSILCTAMLAQRHQSLHCPRQHVLPFCAVNASEANIALPGARPAARPAAAGFCKTRFDGPSRSSLHR